MTASQGGDRNVLDGEGRSTRRFSSEEAACESKQQGGARFEIMVYRSPPARRGDKQLADKDRAAIKHV
jgi:hypothetical protein